MLQMTRRDFVDQILIVFVIAQCSPVSCREENININNIFIICAARAYILFLFFAYILLRSAHGVNMIFCSLS